MIGKQLAYFIYPAKDLTGADIPLYGSVSAGYPAEAYNYIEDRIDLNKIIVRHPTNCFCVWVNDREMLGPGIEYGDLLVFDSQIKPSKKAISLYWIDSEMSLRWIEKTADGITLVCPNPDIPTYRVEEDLEIRHLGTLTHRLKKFENYRHHYGNYPVDRPQYLEKGMDFNQYFLGPEGYWECLFYLRVMGESMTGDGIVKNDLLLVDRLAEGYTDSIYVFLVQTNFTLKRIERHPDYTLLVASNPDFPSLRVEKNVKLEPWGVLTGTVTDYLKNSYETLYSLRS